uniref:F-box domain-containing protein n=1 Tax=Oryza punctata TaxID=4537 RepID=A0A0E0K624_ORYPU
MADRLSELPDDVLVSILRRVDLHNAVRTAILAKRWRHLPAVLPDVVLDVLSFKKKHEDDGFTSKLSREARANFAVAQAAKTIFARRGGEHAIDRLFVRFYLREESIGIVRSVDDAIASGRVRFREVATASSSSNMLANARRLVSFVDGCPRAFAGLTRLRVESVTLRGSDVPNVLATCKNLELLSLLNMEHPRLVRLDIDACDFETVELKWLPRLVHVSNNVWFPSRTLPPPCFWPCSTASDSDTLHCRTLKLSELLVNTTSIRTLQMIFESEKIWFQPESPKHLAPLLRNLRIACLDRIHKECDLIWMMFMLEAAPLSKELRIPVTEHSCGSLAAGDVMRKLLYCEKNSIEWHIDSDFKHYILLLVTVVGFEIKDKFVKLIKRLADAAVNLEDIHIWRMKSNVRIVSIIQLRGIQVQTKREREKES